MGWGMESEIHLQILPTPPHRDPHSPNSVWAREILIIADSRKAWS